MTWKKARKKPIVVEFREVKPQRLIRVKHDELGNTIDVWGEVIETREGTLFGYVGIDYIIRGIEGEPYPIKKEIFEKTYTRIPAGSETKSVQPPCNWEKIKKNKFRAMDIYEEICKTDDDTTLTAVVNAQYLFFPEVEAFVKEIQKLIDEFPAIIVDSEQIIINALKALVSLEEE